MRLGAVVNGYRIVSEPTNQGGGRCVWAFAEKNGREYFVKQFLDPKRPAADAKDTPRTRALHAECAEFENRQRLLSERLDPCSNGAGNLVLPVDFFFERSTYYKVTERIRPAPLEHTFALDSRNKRVLLRSLTLSVSLLHSVGIVHGDLKPENVVIQQRAANAFHVAKLIDLEDSYPAGDPPDNETITGGPPYCSPELLAYMRSAPDADPARITTATDIFSLSLINHRYLTGALPALADGYDSPADMVRAGLPLNIDARLQPPVRMLFEAATDSEPANRPTAEEFFSALEDPGVCVLRRTARWAE